LALRGKKQPSEVLMMRTSRTRCGLLAFLFVAFSSHALAQPAPPPVPEPSPPPGWTGSAGGGLSLARGNSDITNINLSYEAKRDTGSPWLFKSSGLYLRGESDGDLDALRLSLDARVDRRITPRLSVYGQTQYLRDIFKEIEYLVSPDVGLAYDLVKTPVSTLSVNSGVGVIFEKNTGRDLDTSAGLTAGELFTHKIGANGELTQKFNGLWKMDDFADGLYVFGVGLAAGMTDRIQLKFEVLETYKNKPPSPTVKKSDVALLASVIFKY
jgi:putative salt-induced outer membrane protein YdiY